MEGQHSSVSSIKPELIATYSDNASSSTGDVRNAPEPATGPQNSTSEPGSLRHAQLYFIIIFKLYQIELTDLLQLPRRHNPPHSLSLSYPALHYHYHNPPANTPQYSPATQSISLLYPLPPGTHSVNILLPLLRSLKPLHHTPPNLLPRTPHSLNKCPLTRRRRHSKLPLHPPRNGSLPCTAQSLFYTRRGALRRRLRLGTRHIRRESLRRRPC